MRDNYDEPIGLYKLFFKIYSQNPIMKAITIFIERIRSGVRPSQGLKLFKEYSSDEVDEFLAVKD